MLATLALQRKQRTLPWYADRSVNNQTISIGTNTTQSDEGNGVKGVNFAGSYGQIVSAPNSGAFELYDFTVELFIKQLSASNYQGEIGTRNGTGSTPEIWWVSSNSSGAIYWLAGNGTYADSVSASLTLGAWTHLAWVRSGLVRSLYQNGTLLCSVSDPTNYTASTVLIGDNGNFELFRGKMTGIRIVKGQALYTSNFSAPTSLPKNIPGTALLLNFGAFASPAIL